MRNSNSTIRYRMVTERENMGLVGGVLLVAIGVVIYIWGIQCDDYNEWFPGKDGLEGYMSDGYGSLVLIVIAVITCIWTYFFSTFTEVEFGPVYTVFIASIFLVKIIGLASIPLMLESMWYVLTGLQLILPESAFENLSGGLSEKIVVGSVIVLWLIAAFKINTD